MKFLKYLSLFIVGGLIGAFAAIVILDNMGRLLSDEEYEDFSLSNNKDNLIVAYESYIRDNAKILDYLNNNFFEGRLFDCVDTTLMKSLNADLQIMDMAKTQLDNKTPARFSISLGGEK